MLSGRYRCGSLTRHWDNTDGMCKLSPRCREELEDISHILKQCSALNVMRLRLTTFTQDYSNSLPDKVRLFLLECCNPEHPDYLIFLLDCSSLPRVILLTQEFGKIVLNHLFHISRTWIFAIHRERKNIHSLNRTTASL